MKKREIAVINVGSHTLTRRRNFTVETDRFEFLRLFSREMRRLTDLDPDIDPALLTLRTLHGVFDLLEERYPSAETRAIFEEAA